MKFAPKNAQYWALEPYSQNSIFSVTNEWAQ